MARYDYSRRCRYRYVNGQLRFNDYRQITARFNSTGRCGHPISKGDAIGWSKRGGAYCAACWARWVAENAEADAIEAGYVANVY